MNPEILWGLDNIPGPGELIDISDEALAMAMEQSRRSAQAGYRTWSNQALNQEVANFLEYILQHHRSEEILKCILIFMTKQGGILFGELAVFIAPFMQHEANICHINQIYNINYHIKASKSEYTNYINNLISGNYIASDTVKTEEISTMDKLQFDKLDQSKIWFYADILIGIFGREKDSASISDKSEKQYLE